MIEKIFPAKEEYLDEVIDFIETELKKTECSMKSVMQISIAIEEVFVNVVHYAYPEPYYDTKGTVTLKMDYDSEKRIVTFIMIDKGIQFNPLESSDPDITLSADERKIGGLGIFMMKKIMDYVHYSYKNNENILKMQKNL